MAIELRRRWNHTEMCDYCKTQGQDAGSYVYENGQHGCQHFRGGKSRIDRGHQVKLLPLKSAPR